MMKKGNDIMNKEIIKGHEVDYNFFDSENRTMNDVDIEHVGALLEQGYVEGELNQYDHDTDNEVRGWWKKI